MIRTDKEWQVCCDFCVLVVLWVFVTTVTIFGGKIKTFRDNPDEPFLALCSNDAYRSVTEKLRAAIAKAEGQISA